MELPQILHILYRLYLEHAMCNYLLQTVWIRFYFLVHTPCLQHISLCGLIFNCTRLHSKSVKFFKVNCSPQSVSLCKFYSLMAKMAKRWKFQRNMWTWLLTHLYLNPCTIWVINMLCIGIATPWHRWLNIQVLTIWNIPRQKICCRWGVFSWHHSF